MIKHKRSGITINKVPSGKVTFWSGGSAENWVLDNTRIFLREGEQRITVNLPDNLILDHIHIAGPWPDRYNGMSSFLRMTSHCSREKPKLI